MLTVKKIFTESLEKGTYNIDEQQRFRRACEYAQSRQSLYSSQTNSVDLEEASGKKACTWSYQMVAHEYLKNDKSDNQKTGPGHTPMHESAKREWSGKSAQRAVS